MSAPTLDRATAVPLEPLLSPRARAALADTDLLATLAAGLGSPLNVVLPQQLDDNLDGFADVYRAHKLRGAVYFAHKANRSTALVRHLAATAARIDIASTGELQHALSCGFTPDRIMATGPKTPEFLWLAARAGVLVNVDSAGELDLLARTARSGGLGQQRVLLRFSAFDSAGVGPKARHSRFGEPEARLPALLAVLDRHRDTLDLAGVAYHIDTVGVAEKAQALDGCLGIVQRCQRAGHDPRIVDVGGGFGVNYLAHARDWERFTTELAQAVLGQWPPLTWRGHGYGLRAENGRLRGALGLYPAHRPVAGPAYLHELLSQRSPTWGQTYATLLQELMLDLVVEPGRALLDQCGFSLATVLEVRGAPDGERFVRLDVNHGDVSLEEHGVVLDPVLVPTSPGGRPPGSGYLIGNLCLEADFVSRRRIWFPRLPRVGDLLAFPNTAGYFMDFSADHALHQPIARKVAVTSDGESHRWRLDGQYWPLPALDHPSTDKEAQ